MVEKDLFRDPGKKRTSSTRSSRPSWHASPELAEQLNVYQQTLKDKARQMKASELNMQAQHK